MEENKYSCVPGMFIVPGEPEIVTEARARILWTFRELKFDEGPHVYTLNGIKLPSVTTVLGRYMIPFDRDTQAQKYAEKHGETAEYWKNQWKYNNKMSTISGTLVHEFGESMAYLKYGHPERITESCKPKYLKREGWLIPTRPKEEAIVKFWSEIPDCFHLVLAEAKMFTNSNQEHPESWLKQQLAGTSDIIMYYDGQGSPEKAGFTVWDYKGLPLDTPIPSPSGKFIQVKDIKQGDQVFDISGNQQTVLGVSEIHNNPCYQIKFDTGEEVTADHEHRWLLCGETVKTTEDLQPGDKIHIQGDLDIKHNPNIEDAYALGRYMYIENACGRFGIYHDDCLWSSLEQRRDLLRGIMDRTGYFDSRKNRYGVKLSWLTTELLGSLGIKQEFYGDSILFMTDKFYPFKEETRFYPVYQKLKQEKEKVNRLRKSGVLVRTCLDPWQYREVISVKPCEQVPTKCITVSGPTHTYLFGRSMIPTHNTNKAITNAFARSRNEFMYHPFEKLISEPQGEYTAQLSTYQIPLEDLGLKVIDRRLIWLKPDGTYEKIPLPDITKLIRQNL